MFLKDLHGFRGFAIINIVLAHTGSMIIFSEYFMLDKARPPAWENSFAMNSMLFHDSTLYFALISGLLFSVVLARKGWSAFYTSKLRNVISPYIVMSAIFTVIVYQRSEEQHGIAPFESFHDFIATLGENILHGTASFQYWYIPTLSILFLLTPLVWSLCRRAPWLVWMLGLLPLAVARTDIDLTPQTIIYFLGAYSIGIVFGMNYQRNIDVLKKWWFIFAIIALVTSIYLYFPLRKAEPFTPLGLLIESLFYLQKLSIAALVLALLNQYKGRIPGFLSLLGTYAFPIYFLHIVFTNIYTAHIIEVFPPPFSGPMVVALDIVSIIFVLSVTLGVSMLIKKLFGRYSRSIIGA